MFLQKIEIQGFKSFAQKVTLEFPRPDRPMTQTSAGNGVIAGVACIVGPNGSGKSNIVDAIRWVLGEQSLKSLRGKKSEDVIFSGSDKKARLGMAQVSLHVNNEDGAMPVDFQEVVISRKLYRNGESEYIINKSKVRLQDVLLLLAKSNFGQKSYSIVSQGSIDQVIMATPNERKEYFDEAVGVKQFQLKRDQSINKLENAWNNLRQVDALLTEITPRLNSLTRQVKRLERRAKVEAELTEASRKYYGFLWADLESKTKEVKPRLVSGESKLLVKAKELHDLQSHLRSLENQDSRSKVFNDLQQAHQKILDEKNKLREEQLILQNKIELAKQRLTDKPVPMALPEILRRLKELDLLEVSLTKNLVAGTAAELAQAREDAREIGRLLKDLVEQLENPKVKSEIKNEIDPEILVDLKGVTADLEGVDQRLVAARTAIENFNAAEEKKKGKFFDLQRQITVKQEEYNKLASEISSLRVEMARLETRQQDLSAEIRQETGDLAWLKNYPVEKIDEGALRSEINQLKHQLELIGGVDPEIVGEYEQTKERFDFLTEQGDDLRKSINDLEQVINELDEQIQQQFDTSFKHINHEFTKFFKILFNGGKAELVLIKDEADPKSVTGGKAEAETESEPEFKPGILKTLEAAEERLSPKRFLKKRTGKVITGIDIIATPPGKKVSAISMLSGGERSLASIALICAVIYNNPSPFVILDEVDAALDEANSQRFAKIVRELAHKTQFIVITHNRATMHQASILYGVTMGDEGISKLISLKLEEAERVVRQ
ncbi:MAG: AAA family ATPase [Patescibacteria group bacterium]|nr:AAA family ATPase [Patescibacteria group bacterium]